MSIDPNTKPTLEAAETAEGAETTTVQVVGIRFRHSKTLWFDPNGHNPRPGDRVVATTERGTELGECVQATWEVPASELPAPLKPVLRIADDEDLHLDKELQDEERAAMPIFREYIEKNEVDMKPADIEILLGKEKIIFYFSAEERIDFRQLVRDLAAHFHCRIEMRQVGVRDEARMTGGIGHCGEVLCCARLGGEFAPVSIKMAKDQGLPLNPSKISGVCGRLMCCLRYEVDAYKDFNSRAPKKGAMIDTPRGGGKVVERDALRETVKLQFRSEDGEKLGDTLMVPLARMCCKDKKGKKRCGSCPCAVAPDVFAELEEESKRAKVSALSADGLDYRGLSSTQGTGSEIDNGQEQASRPKRRRSGVKDGKKEDAGDSREGKSRKRSNRRNKGRKRGKGSEQSGDQQQSQQGKQQRGQSKGQGEGSRKSRPKGSGKHQRNRNRSAQQQKDSAPNAETRVPRRRRRSE